MWWKKKKERKAWRKYCQIISSCKCHANQDFAQLLAALVYVPEDTDHHHACHLPSFGTISQQKKGNELQDLNDCFCCTLGQTVLPEEVATQRSQLVLSLCAFRPRNEDFAPWGRQSSALFQALNFWKIKYFSFLGKGMSKDTNCQREHGESLTLFH